QQGHRLQLEHVAAGPRQRARRRVALADAGAVGEEDHVELAALGGLGAADIVLDMQGAIRRHVGMAPGGRVIAVAADRKPEPHLASRHRFVSSGGGCHAGVFLIKDERLQCATSSPFWLKARWAKMTMPWPGRDLLSRISSTSDSTRTVSPWNSGL